MIYIEDSDNPLVLNRVDLTRDRGFIVSQYDPGFPEIREVTQNYVGQNGVIDSTQYHGASLATLQFVILGVAGRSRWDILGDVMYHMLPFRRSYVHWTLNDEGGESRCQQFRVSKINRPVDKSNRLYVGASLVVPSGLIQSSELVQARVGPSSVSAEIGRSYDLDHDRVYPASEPLGSTEITNLGNSTAWPLIRIHGTCTNPRISNETSGLEYDFSGVALGSGEYIEIDTVNRTIVNQAGISVMDDLDFTTSQWWGLDPGDSVLVFEPDSYTPGTAEIEVIYRHAWI